MPYIPQEDRRGLDPDIHSALKAGELNFQITSLVHSYLERKGITYTTLNEVVGVLECAKLELYRRLAAPYEDQKVRENGDVLPFNSPERAN